jgi:hypothetical protein
MRVYVVIVLIIIADDPGLPPQQGDSDLVPLFLSAYVPLVSLLSSFLFIAWFHFIATICYFNGGVQNNVSDQDDICRGHGFPGLGHSITISRTYPDNLLATAVVSDNLNESSDSSSLTVLLDRYLFPRWEITLCLYIILSPVISQVSEPCQFLFFSSSVLFVRVK